MTDCLDSWAILRWLEGVEPAASRVEVALASRPVMSWINLGEVAHIVERLGGSIRSSQVVRELRHQLNLDLPTEVRVLEASRIKAANTMAYAGAFAVSTAIAYDCTLLTGDPEILDANPMWQTLDLRS